MFENKMVLHDKSREKCNQTKDVLNRDSSVMFAFPNPFHLKETKECRKTEKYPKNKKFLRLLQSTDL